MFSKAFAIVIAIAAGVHAHAGVSPALGVQGQLTRSAVQRPSAQKPCGNANLNAIATSTPVQAAADGTFSATAINFNGGKDGSRQFTATVDATGTGKTFNGQVQITTNGDAAPQGTGTQPLVAQLPAGTKCSGGASGNLCLVSFKSAAGFGNCVVVAQGGTGAAAGNATGGATGGAGGATGGATTGNTGATNANNGAANANNGTTKANNGAAKANKGAAKANNGAAKANNGAAKANNSAQGAAAGRVHGRPDKAQKGKQAAAAAPAAQGGTRAPRFARYVAELEQ